MTTSLYILGVVASLLGWGVKEVGYPVTTWQWWAVIVPFAVLAGMFWP